MQIGSYVGWQQVQTTYAQIFVHMKPNVMTNISHGMLGYRQVSCARGQCHCDDLKCRFYDRTAEETVISSKSHARFPLPQ